MISVFCACHANAIIQRSWLDTIVIPLFIEEPAAA